MAGEGARLVGGRGFEVLKASRKAEIPETSRGGKWGGDSPSPAD